MMEKLFTILNLKFNSIRILFGEFFYDVSVAEIFILNENSFRKLHKHCLLQKLFNYVLI